MFHYRQVRINLYLNLVCFAVKNFIGNIFGILEKYAVTLPPYLVAGLLEPVVQQPVLLV